MVVIIFPIFVQTCIINLICNIWLIIRCVSICVIHFGNTPKVQLLLLFGRRHLKKQDAAVTGSRDEMRRRRAAAGRKSTLLTGAQGATSSASTSGKTLLGQ